MIEYAIWGKPSQKHNVGTDEQLLVTEIGDRRKAEAYKRALETELSCTECRIQKIDLSTPPNFKPALTIGDK
jgi:hypothetical protein